MSNPIVFISRNRVKPGLLADFQKHYAESIPVTEASKPSTLVQLAYLNQAGNELEIIRVFPDAESLDAQLQGADQRSKAVYQYIEPTGIVIYGQPSAFALEMMKKVAGSGIEVNILPAYTGGFIRPSHG